MRSKVLNCTVLFALLIGYAAAAQEPTISIRLDNDRFLFGQTTYATYTISNTSDAPIYISGYQEKSGQFQVLRWNAEAFCPNGKLVPYYKDFGRFVGEENTFPKRLLKKGEAVVIYQPVPVTDVPMPELGPGQYKLAFTLSYSLSPSEGLWEKEKKEGASFQIAEALGEDTKYLGDLWQAIQGAERANLMRPDKSSPLRWNEVLQPPIKGYLSNLLMQHPTSVYAASVVRQSMIWAGDWEPTERNKSLFIGSLETGSYLSNSYPDDTGQSKDGWRELKGEEAAKWWDKWITIILKNHPDIWFADELRLRRALNQIALKKFDAGAADLKTLARDAKEPVASRTKFILQLIQEKGWIKAEPAASTPPAVPVPEKAAPPKPSTPAPAKPSGGGA